MDIDVSPDMGMYNLLRRQGYETCHALAEYIDNSIHAWQLKKTATKLKIELYFYSMDHKDPKKKNSIKIKDNGPGIDESALARAFKPATEPTNKGLSEFGIGMKAASVWFSDKWSVYSYPIGNKKYYFNFNLHELMRLGSSKVTVRVEEKKNPALTGVTISLKDIRKPIDRVKAQEIFGDLCEMYRKFSDGLGSFLDLSAEFDDTPIDIKYEAPDRTILDAPVYRDYKGKLYAIGEPVEWHSDISFKFNGHQVRGFIQINKQSSTKSNPGLVLFRHNRVITGTARMPFVPEKLYKTANKFSKQRVYGELHLDGLPVSYTKDKFEIDEDQFVDKINDIEDVKNIFRQSESYRVKNKPIIVPSEAKMREAAKDDEEKKKPTDPTGNQKPTGNQRPEDPKPQTGFVSILGSLNTNNLALQDVIRETIKQYNAGSPISAALCLRIVFEVGVHDKIRNDINTQYPNISEKGIHSLINYMHSHIDDFLDRKADYNVIKCIQSIAIETKQSNASDIIFINNIAHGHFTPTIPQLDRFIANIQPILEWAYS